MFLGARPPLPCFEGANKQPLEHAWRPTSQSVDRVGMGHRKRVAAHRHPAPCLGRLIGSGRVAFHVIDKRFVHHAAASRRRDRQ